MTEKVTTEEIRLLIKMISQGYKVPKVIHDVVYDAAVRGIEEKDLAVIYKRDPNIERSRMQGAYVKIIEGKTIEIHPAVVGGFGADFDGDSFRGGLRCYTENKIGQTINTIKLDSDEFLSKFRDHLYMKSKNGHISKYGIKDNIILTIDSINVDTGEVSRKRITEFSIHEDIELYKLNDTKHRFEDFWASSDHSLIVYDEGDDKIKKISPVDLLDNPTGKYLIKQNEKRGLTNDEQGATYQ